MALASGLLWGRDPHLGEAGVSNKFKAAGAASGATVRLYYGSSTGQTAVSGCTNVYVGIANASVLGEATAASNGAAIHEASVPGGWTGLTRYLQAVDLSDCRSVRTGADRFAAPHADRAAAGQFREREKP